jgi:hypothetical protein
MKGIRGLLIGALLAISGAAHAQFQGELSAGRVLGNPNASAGRGQDATLTAMFDRAFCGTNGSLLARVGGAWGCQLQPPTRVDFAHFNQGSALSVLGVAGNAIADFASIVAASDFQVLRRSGTSVGFGAVNLASSNAVTNQLPIANGGCNGTTAATCLANIMPTPTRAGDIVYWNGSAWVSLAGNNAGNKVLQEDATGVPSWVTAGTGTVTSAVIAGAGLASVSGTCTITTTGTCTVTVTAATQSDQETASSTTVAVTPGRQQFHPSAVKAHCRFDGTTAGGPNACLGNPYNVSGVTRVSAGVYNVTFSTAFSSANYSCTFGVGRSGGGTGFGTEDSSLRTTSVLRLNTFNSAFAAADMDRVDVICSGDQ